MDVQEIDHLSVGEITFDNSHHGWLLATISGLFLVNIALCWKNRTAWTNPYQKFKLTHYPIRRQCRGHASPGRTAIGNGRRIRHLAEPVLRRAPAGRWLSAYLNVVPHRD
jgi:hypothetical protein